MAAKKTTATKAKVEEELIDPFSVAETKSAPAKSKGLKSVKPDDPELCKLVDTYKELKSQLDYFEGEVKVAAESLKAWGLTTYSERRMDGVEGNFNILGDTEELNYLVIDNAAFIDPETVKILRDKYGDDFNSLVQIDKKTVKFDQDFLADDTNRTELLKALQPLGKDFLSGLFTKAKYKAVKGATNKAVMIADTAKQLEEIITDIQITNYVKVPMKRKLPKKVS